MLQAIQETSDQQPFLPSAFLLSKQVSHQCIKLAYTETFTFLDFVLSRLTEVSLTQGTSSVASVTIY